MHLFTAKIRQIASYFPHFCCKNALFSALSKQHLNYAKVSMNIKVSVFFCATIMASGSVYSADYANAEKVFEANCATCHGSDRNRYIGPALNSSSRLGKMPEVAIEAIINGGVNDTLMPAWAGRLPKSDIKDLAALIKNKPKSNPKWEMADIKKSLKVYVKDEASLPKKPTYKIKNVSSLMAVMARGRYSNGKNSKVVFFNGENNEIVGEIPTLKAPHILNYNPADERWAYVKTDGGRIFKIDLYSMKATRSIKVGFTGPSLAVSWDGKYIAAGSFIPNTAVILDAKTLNPVKYIKLKGKNLEGKMIESDSGSITATPFVNVFAIALEQSGQVWIADLDKKDIPITKIEKVGRHLHDAFLAQDGRYLTIAAYDDNKLAVIDLKTKEKIKDIPAGCVPHTGSGAIIKVGNRTLGFGTNFGSGSSCKKTVVTVFDAKTFEVVKQIPVIGGTESPAAHPNAPYVVVDIISGANADKIQFIDKKTLEVVKTLTPGGHSHFPEYTADGKYLYVSAGYAGDKVIIYDSKTLKKVKEVSMEVPAGIFSHARPKNIVVGM